MADSGSGAGDVFDIERIRVLIELMKEHGLSELDLQQQDQAIRLRREGPPAPGMVLPPVAAAPLAPAAAPAEPEDGPNIVYIKSPMVGTLYLKANPNAELFVKVGDHVGAETTVCIIEAMKVFNEIPAEVSGRVIAILADNEEPVDHNRPLFKIDTSQ